MVKKYMNLKEVVTNLFNRTKSVDPDIQSSLAAAEKFLEQAYESRYFFELIQNVRDANKEIDQDGEIFIEIVHNVLSISNTGAEFNAKGINGIAAIGKSTKSSQEYIGFKGIGFKSIQEVTETPQIVTRYGTVYFDKKETLIINKTPNVKEDDIPLFFFPHFKDVKLSAQEVAAGIVTRIELPIKETVTEDSIVAAFSAIRAQQLILLGNIKTLNFKAGDRQTCFLIRKDLQSRLIEVQENETPKVKFRFYSPNNKTNIPQEVIRSLSGKEKDLFSSNPQVDINIVMELKENMQVNIIKNAKLYLFYPLQISSGFRFIIHSYFIVNPERTALRKSPLNDFLLQSIGLFIGDEILRHLKEKRANTNNILCFSRNQDANLDVLYNSVVNALKMKKFIYDNKTQRYFLPSEVMVSDIKNKDLFPDGKLGEQQLIFTDDSDIIKWLRDEFKVSILSIYDIPKEIENECKKQSKLKNIKYFQNLYNYVSHNQQINLTGKKVLLTDQWKLVSSEDDVFYGGNRKNNIEQSIKKHIHFIHKDIKISDFRDGKSRTGITEFNTHELVKRLVKLFEKDSVPNEDIINTLISLSPLDTKSELEVKEKIKLPVQDNSSWLSPVFNPIYFETEPLKDLYPKGHFIDEKKLHWNGAGLTEDDKHNFLKKYGVWEIPAVFVYNRETVLDVKDARSKLIESLANLKPYFYLTRDRLLDKPIKYTPWYTKQIVENWNSYKSFLIADHLPKLQYFNSHSNKKNALDYTAKLSSFIDTLRNQKWIVFSGEDDAYAVKDVVGITSLDYNQAHNQVIKKFLNLMPLNYDQKIDLIESMELVHLDSISMPDFIKLFNRVYQKYKVNTPNGKDFVDFYNRLLGKLVNFFYSHELTENIKDFSSEIFLCINDTNKELHWAKASQIFYIDDKPNYDLLPLSIKEKVQPHFTNRDKNTFGKIAGKIGKRFSDSIQKELIQSDSLKAETLTSYFKFLPEAIALLECFFETVMLGDFFDKLKTVRVYKQDQLELAISVADSDKMVIPVSHFIDTNDNNAVYISENTDTSSKNVQLANAISELFMSILGREPRVFNSNLLSFLKATNKDEFLKDYDIQEVTVSEIRDKLNTTDYSAEQRFWETILITKKINCRENCFLLDTFLPTELAILLNLDVTLLIKIKEEFDFNLTSNVKNISLLKLLLTALSLSLEDINQTLFPKIDYRDFYFKQLIVLQNNFEKRFNFLLYQELANKSSVDQANYQNLLDDYKKSIVFKVPLNTLTLNVKEFFCDILNNSFDFYRFTEKDLERKINMFNPVVFYTANLSVLQSQLASVEYTEDMLESFLADSKHRSLLYFDGVEAVANSFKEWLTNNSSSYISAESDNELELSQYTNSEDISIEDISTCSVNLSSSWAAPKVGGNRFDGGASDKKKKLIGQVAEMIVFEKLKTLHDNTEWVSKFASKVAKTHIGYNPEGQDGLGYDILYTDSEGNKHFVEVKGTSDERDSFEISRFEIETAQRNKEFYQIFFVTHTLDNTKRRIKNLGNLFLLDEGQDFFTNTKFLAVTRNFEIRFQEQ